jgi:hypothetical protein
VRGGLRRLSSRSERNPAAGAEVGDRHGKHDVGRSRCIGHCSIEQLGF